MDIWATIAALFVSISLLSSFYLITQHLIYYNKPYLQKYIIRILWLVPIYSVNCWIGLVYPKAAIYLDIGRECYEAFAVYSFMKFLLNYLHYDLNLDQIIDFKPGIPHTFPFCFLGISSRGHRFLNRVKNGVLQYIVVRPITTIVSVISQLIGVYGEGNLNPFSGFMSPVLLYVNNASQILAMYCLVIFYSSYKLELSALKPLPKFLCIKLVIFFSFFQSVIISFAIEFTDSQSTMEDKLTKGRRIQDFLICLEMLFASLAHHYAYSYTPYMETRFAGANQSCCFTFLRTLDFSDDTNDVRDHFYQGVQKVKSTFRQVRIGRPLPPVVILDGDEPYEYTPLKVLNSNLSRSASSSVYSTLPSQL